MARTFSLADLPAIIPIFPLPGALLLPRARLPLNIFEPRYLAMLDDTLKTDHRLIGMIQPIVMPEGKASGRLHQIGCAGRVTSLQETDDGRYLITLSGVSRFRLGALQEGFSPYRRASVDWSSFERDLGRAERDPAFDRDAFLEVLARFFATAQLNSDWDALRRADEELLVNSLSMLCPFDPEEKQALLEAPTLANRRETLVTLMEFALRSGGEEDLVQ
jgi:uncharacterized protein